MKVIPVLRAALLFVLGLSIGLLVLEEPTPPHRRARAVEPTEDGATPRTLGRDWGRVVVRASTGAPPVTPPAAPPSGSTTGPAPEGRVGPAPGPPHPTAVAPATPTAGGSAVGRAEVFSSDAPLPDPELQVRPGQNLSTIAYEYYGSASPSLVRALADYNGLQNPDALAAGATIRLPDRARLEP